MILLVQKIASWYLKRRLEVIEQFMRYPHQVQEELFHSLVWRARNTAWGKEYGYQDTRDIDTFRQRVPINTYEEIYSWIERSFQGEADVLWPGRMAWFAKSSGTTNDKSKYIPVTDESLEECHLQAGKDMLAVYFSQKPDSKLFTGKSLSIGGSHTVNQINEFARYGDISAVITENLPIFYELMRTPSKKVALMPDWEEKLEAMVEEVIHEDVTAMVGVPTWTMVLINRIFEKLGIEDRNLRKVWPNLELYCHGGVSFAPYRTQFEQIIPGNGMNYMDCYNASEGFFGFQNDLDQEDILLLLDYGIFYEFIPVEDIDQDHPQTHILPEVELGQNYAVVISTNGGLWRYSLGDTVTFTSKDPYKIRVTGRTKHFINAFGEELMVENAEIGISTAASETGAVVSNFTAAPIYLEGTAKGGHEWLIEFETPPDNLERFGRILDQKLKDLNSDYEAKRQGDLALLSPKLHALPKGTFNEWMGRRGKLGGQNKVPRLSNNRNFVEDILAMTGSVT